MKIIYVLFLAIVFLNSCKDSAKKDASSTIHKETYSYEFVANENSPVYVLSPSKARIFYGSTTVKNINSGIQRSTNFKSPVIEQKIYGVATRSAKDMDSNIYVVREQKDKKILIAGSFGYVNGIKRNSIARLNTDGSLDKDFLDNLSGVNGEIYDLELLENGKILIGGYFTEVNNKNIHSIARLNADGSLDESFALRIKSGIVQDIMLSDKHIILSGVFSSINNINVGSIVKFNKKYDIDLNFTKNTVDLDGIIYKTIRLNNEKVLAIGNFNDLDSNSLIVINNDGSLDRDFISEKISGYIFDAIKLKNGDIFIGGNFDVTEKNISNLAIIKQNGEVVGSMENIGSVYSISKNGDKNEILIGGDLDSKQSNIVKIKIK